MTTSAANALPPLPVTVVSGYLGAGKTTLVNAILAGDHGLRIAVLVNDFGSIAIDETLISGRGTDVIALTNGCMCCQVGGALYEAIDRILGMREHFDHLLIETSGVADPAKIAQIAVAEPDLELSQTIALVDALNFTPCLEDLRLADTLLRQLREATLVLVTKAEQASAELHSDLHIALAQHTAGIETARLARGCSKAWRYLTPAHRAERTPAAFSLSAHRLPFESWSWRGNTPVDSGRFVAFARDPSLNAYRLKGRLRLSDGRAIVVNKVASDVAIEDVRAEFETSELVAIGAEAEFDPTRLSEAWAQVILSRSGSGEEAECRIRSLLS